MCVQVILVVPWLALSDQALIFPNQRTFERPAEQEECMRDWIKKRTGLAPDFEIVWYPGAAHRTCSTYMTILDLNCACMVSSSKHVPGSGQAKHSVLKWPDTCTPGCSPFSDIRTQSCSFTLLCESKQCKIPSG